MKNYNPAIPLIFNLACLLPSRILQVSTRFLQFYHVILNADLKNPDRAANSLRFLYFAAFQL